MLDEATPAFGSRKKQPTNINFSGLELLHKSNTMRGYKKRKSNKNMFCFKSPEFLNSKSKSQECIKGNFTILPKIRVSKVKKKNNPNPKLDLIGLLKYGVVNAKENTRKERFFSENLIENKRETFTKNRQNLKKNLFEKNFSLNNLLKVVKKLDQNEEEKKKGEKRKEIFYLKIERRENQLNNMTNLSALKNIPEMLERSYNEDKLNVFDKMYTNQKVIDKKFVKAREIIIEKDKNHKKDKKILKPRKNTFKFISTRKLKSHSRNDKKKLTFSDKDIKPISIFSRGKRDFKIKNNFFQFDEDTRFNIRKLLDERKQFNNTPQFHIP